KMNHVFARRYIVEPVERIATVSYCVNWIELRSVEETTGPQTICGDEPSRLRSSNTKVCFDRRSTERAILREYFAFRSHESKAGAGGGIDDKTCFIAKFGIRRTGYDLHVLNRVNRNLR